MNGRRFGHAEPADNPWVRHTDDADQDERRVEPEPPVSPWNYPVDPPPGTSSPVVPDRLAGGPDAALPRRSRPAGSSRRLRLLVPMAVAAVVVAGAMLLPALGDDRPASSPASPASHDTSSTSPGSGGDTPTGERSAVLPTATRYLPPANAIPVAHGVVVVPMPDWTLFTADTTGRELVLRGPEGYRAWFWVRQRMQLTAESFAVGIFEGETKGGSQTKASPVQRVGCPGAVLVECASISYRTVLPRTRGGAAMWCQVQAFRRVDGLVTAVDFCARPDQHRRASADAAVMLRSVIDSQ